ncbi:MAG: hypothetical protein H6962_06810 [Chromatiaceae bacterium]|nr:hypothetical protein [Chromatiaceae bacterium]
MCRCLDQTVRLDQRQRQRAVARAADQALFYPLLQQWLGFDKAPLTRQRDTQIRLCVLEARARASAWRRCVSAAA